MSGIEGIVVGLVIAFLIWCVVSHRKMVKALDDGSYKHWDVG